MTKGSLYAAQLVESAHHCCQYHYLDLYLLPYLLCVFCEHFSITLIFVVLIQCNCAVEMNVHSGVEP